MATLRTKKEQLCALKMALIEVITHGLQDNLKDEIENNVYNSFDKEDTFDLKTAIEKVEEISKACTAVLKTLKKTTLESEDKSKIDLCAVIIYSDSEGEKEEGEVEDEKDDCKKRKKNN